MKEKKRKAQEVKNMKDELIKEMKKDRGYMFPTWIFLADKDAEFLKAYNELYQKALNKRKALPAKIREFVAMAILAYKGRTEAVYEHAKRAMRLGATKQELLEVFQTAMLPSGAPTLTTGLQVLMRMENEEKAGVED